MINCWKIPPWLKSKCKGKVREEGKSEIMLVCWRLTNDPYQNHDS